MANGKKDLSQLRMRLFKYGNYDHTFQSTVKIEVKEMETFYKVLDHGFVQYKGHFGTEEDIIEAARQSTQKGFLGWDSDAKLLEYLYKNKHMTPFEMCELRVQIKAPIFIFREIHRHRTFSYNEMSARYIQMPNEHYVPTPRMQSEKNRQASVIGEDLSKLQVHFGNDGEGKLSWMELWEHEQKEIFDSYEMAIEEGIAKEIARINTPVSRYSIMWMKGSLRNWLQFLALRNHPAAQLEMQQYAQAIKTLMRDIWPRTMELYDEYTKYAVMLSRSEASVLQNLLEKLENKYGCLSDTDLEHALIKRIEKQ